ncbi:MAG: peptidyl-tRNA hydrolase Pth2 [Candidatus Nanohaloarchaea archaeon]
MTSYKQAIVLEGDAGMSKGKLISQACHASLNAYMEADEEEQEAWKEQGSKKVVLELGEHDIEELYRDALGLGLPVYLVKDAGLTEVEPGTVTALGVGPAEESKIDKITGELELVK